MGVQSSVPQAVSSRLITLIAHDRAVFGGAICTTGITVLFCVWCARPAKSLWQVLCFSGVVGFASAIGIHPVVGYNNLLHLAPAILGSIIFLVGLVLAYPTMHNERAIQSAKRTEV